MCLNLLIEGKQRCGKSRAIVDALKMSGLFESCGGYRTVRVFSPSGVLRGYSHIAAALDIGEDIVSDSSIPSAGDRDIPMFISFEGDKHFDADLFAAFIKKALSGTAVPLIVMDEAGGAELVYDGVAEAYLNVLKGPVPCLGVIKNKESGSRAAGPRYSAFREEVLKNGTVIVDSEGLGQEKLVQLIKKWLDKNVRPMSRYDPVPEITVSVSR